MKALVVVLVLLGGGGHAASQQEAMSRAVEVTTVCASKSGWGPFLRSIGNSGDPHAVYVPEKRHVVVSPRACDWLGQRRNLHLLGHGIHTLSHERQHVLGISDEYEAECRGGRTWLEAAMRYGLRREFAIRVARRYFNALYYPMPPECRPPGI